MNKFKHKAAMLRFIGVSAAAMGAACDLRRPFAADFDAVTMDRVFFDGENAGAGGATEADVKKLADAIKEATEALKTSKAEMQKVAETADKETKALGKITDETKKSFDDLFSKHNGLVARFEDMEQKLARRTNDDSAGARLKTIGQLVVENEGLKGFDSGAQKSVRVQISRKDLMTVTGTLGTETSGATSLIPSQRIPGIVMPPERQMTVRDLIAPGETSSNLIEYAQETGFTNNAGVVSEGATKPKSEITFELKAAPVRTIAHIFKASRQIMDDAPALRSYIDARARYGLRFAEEEEILAGDGTGQHLNGIIPQAADFDRAFTPANPQAIDSIRLAMLQVVLAEFPPTGIVLNPILRTIGLHPFYVPVCAMLNFFVLTYLQPDEIHHAPILLPPREIAAIEHVSKRRDFPRLVNS